VICGKVRKRSAAGGNHAKNYSTGGPGGAGLNQATINNITYNFKSYFANNNTFGHNDNGYIGGGGAGKSQSQSTTQALGGTGGGGKGRLETNPVIYPTAGAANTGSGGGAGDTYVGGDSSGGSGIVIIRYRL
jgi:hypothetical protein